MKLSVSTSPRGFKVRSVKGFALIATMVLMILLATVAVAVMSIAASQNRISAHSVNVIAARQQALVGLDAAIGALQVEMGPDQRVSASSGIFASDGSTSPEAAHVLGVWNSWDGPVYGKSLQGHASSIKDTYDKGRTKMFRRWLISTKGQSLARNPQAYKQISARMPGSRICLVGEGTLGSMAGVGEYVYADLVKMPGVGKNTSEMAWWIGGENQKANVAIKNREETSDTLEILRRTWDTPAPVISGVESLSFLPEELDKSDALLSVASLPLVVKGARTAGFPYFFDVTARSQSLITNVRTGGLKQDLNLLLSKEKLSSTEFARRTNQDCPIVEQGGDLAEATCSQRPIGSWQTLHAYYNTWPDGSAKDSDNFTGRLIGSVDDAYTRMSGSGYYTSDGKYADLNNPKYSEPSQYDTKSMLDEGNDEAGYARTPTMLAFVQNLSLTAGATGTNATVAGTDTGEMAYALRMSNATLVTWWNPYNVPMKIRSKQMSSNAMPYMMTNLQMRVAIDGSAADSFSGGDYQYIYNKYGSKYEKSDQFGNFYWGRGCLQWTYNPISSDDVNVNGSYGYGNETGSYYVLSENSDGKDIEFEPGEILFFSPCEGTLKDASATVASEYNSLSVGYNPNKVNNLAGLFYRTASVDSAGLANTLTTPSNMSNKQFAMLCRFPVMEPINCNNLRHANDADLFYLTGSGSETTGGYGNWMHNGYYPEAFEAMSVRVHFTTDPSPRSPEDCIYDSDILQNGKSPYLLQTAWYDEEEIGDDDSNANICDYSFWEDISQLTDMDSPYFVASYGIVNKSGNGNLFPKFFPADFRTKVWQHSNPALGGDILISPDDSERFYHPYHIASIPVDTGMSSSPMDNIGDNGTWGVTSDGEQVSYISAFELPVHPPFSLAAFSGMKLLPGWYEIGLGKDEGLAREFALRCQRGVPTNGIGNAFADPTLPATDVYAKHDTDIDSYPNTQEGYASGGSSYKIADTDAKNNSIFMDYYDHGFIINDGLWDRFFCSSVSDMPAKGGGKITAETTLTSFLNGEDELPVSRYKKAQSAYSSSSVISRIMEDDGWKYIAEYLVVEGGFNVNSTSVDAWAATLMGLANRKLVSNVNEGKLTEVERSKRDDEVLFSRFMLSTTDKALSDNFSPMMGSSSLRSGMGMTTAWGEVRKLSSEQIRELAEEMVKQVRRRGPFLNMSDFINRRLETGDNSLKGALQAAIDETDINACFNEVELTVIPTGVIYEYPKADMGSAHSGAPGYLIQSDVLSSLGNILTVRDDTFVVRAYGCVRNARKAVLAQAWCEATVQRTIDYVDPTNKPEDVEYNADGTKGKGLSAVNQSLGRKFKVIAFRWLDYWDI